ncbi:hypothetical protein [Streptosporangium sp. NPDC000396]|uniref:hypothetical protein n=1 Tax=Streptosporangium sp. NPDC000396 TaxID=3366185 RepID=UPI0036BB717D
MIRKGEPSFELLSRMARREAMSLTLIPDLEVRVDSPRPRILFDTRECPWCEAGMPGTRAPLREVASAAGAAGLGGSSPELSVLHCEELTARSLLPLSLIRTVEGAARPRLSTRASFWADFIGSAPLSHDDVLRGLETLDSRESWLDDLLPAFHSGHAAWTQEIQEPSRVLPASTRITHPGGVDGVLASRQSLHFLTPHMDGALVGRLNGIYLSARMAAVRDALKPPAHCAFSL